MSIYQVDDRIEKLEKFISIFSTDLERLYLERELFQEDLSEKSKLDIFKYENIILEYSEELEQLYFTRGLILNAN